MHVNFNLGCKSMKKSQFVTVFLFWISSALFSQDTLVLKFHSESPLDSISIENLNNRSYQVLKGTDRILFHFPTEDTVDTPTFISEINTDRNDLLIYPNPFQGRTTVEFQSDQSSLFSLSVYDMAGKLVTGIDMNVDPGMHRCAVELDSPGMYLCRIGGAKNAYTGLMVNTGSVFLKPAIKYIGPGVRHPSPPETSQETIQELEQTHRKSTFANTVSDSTANLGDMLRLSGHSGSEVDVIYDYLDADSTYEFNIQQVGEGVYLHVNDTLLYAPDTIRCFVTNSGYHFTNDVKGELIFSRDSLLLQPVTHGGKLRPDYAWEIENPDVWIIDTIVVSSGILHPVNFRKDTSIIKLKDHANKFSADFVLIMEPDDFVGPGIVIGNIQNDNTLDEISGMAASIKNPGAYWVHNDSGDEARIFLIDTMGHIICTVNIFTEFTDNRDWEDICVGPGPVEGESYIYIAEIGDLNKEYDNKYIFRITEPAINMETRGQRMNIAKYGVSTITFDYKYGPRDAEILMIDPSTRDLYIVTKREEKVQVYPIPYPQNYDEKIILTKSTVFLPFRLANGGDISADGQEILIKNLDRVFYWKLMEGESILDALAREGRQLPYTKEPQGEAIAWMRDGSGYLTVSEAKNNITPKIYLYKRQW